MLEYMLHMQATATVMEMTALAGTIGRHLASASGADQLYSACEMPSMVPGNCCSARSTQSVRAGASAEVADAVYESVLPRNAGDATPQSSAGILVSMVDR